jgi:phosphatidylethanolamine/phosphatidyl-N-methylethanolamine N-methyltransferase
MNTENENMYNSLYNEIFISAKKGSAKNIMHKFLEKNLNSHYPRVLEIGANNLEHYDFVKHSFDRYLATDIRVPLNLDLNMLPGKVEFSVADVCNLESLNNDSFDRVFSTCVIQHVLDPEAAFREMFRVTKIGGRIDILIQNDIGPLFKLIRKWTTLRNAKKYNLLNEVELFFAREHRNNLSNIITIIRLLTKNQNFSIASWPLNFSISTISIFKRITVIKVSTDLVSYKSFFE